MMLQMVKYYFFDWLAWLKDYIFLMMSYSTVKLHVGARCRNSSLGKYVTIYDKAVVRYSKIGNYTYIASNSFISHCEIGSYCSIGPNVIMGYGTHPTRDFVTTSPIFFSSRNTCQITYADKSYFEERKPIEIGNDVWIGANVFIVDGIKIGDGAIIAAGAVVTKDVPAYAIMGGVPAKIIRYRFLPVEIELLEKDKWWDKEEKWLKDHYKLFHDIKQYIDYLKTDNSKKW